MTVPLMQSPAGITLRPLAPVQAPFLGVVMLDTCFPRPPGDLGNVETYTVPVNIRVVRGIWPDKVVQSATALHAGRVGPAFAAVVRGLAQEGAAAITTTCGFLVLLQKELQAAVKVPVITSSLMLLPGLLAAQPRVGVLTISASKLGKEYLRAAGVPRERLGDVIVQGVDPKGEFATRILGNQPEMDLALARADVVAAAVALKAREPSLTDVVLECTNMPPYRDAIHEATGLKTWCLLDDQRLFRAWKAAPDAATSAPSAGAAR
jgi:hypothetical protein